MEFLKTSSLLLSLSGLAFGGLIHSRQENTQLTSRASWPVSYIAMGDSFAAGVGAGNYFTPKDSEVMRCKRFASSYPSLAKTLVPSITSFDFVACSGDKLDGLTDQHAKLGTKKADVVTLSISGNDFLFGKVVEDCIFNYGSAITGKSDADRNSDCAKTLAAAEAAVDADTVWNTYTQALQKILDTRLTSDSRSMVIITGYAQFFAEAEDADACTKARFRIPGTPPTVKGNLVLKSTRDKMNDLVQKVNSNIKTKIVAPKSSKVQFVDIDAHTQNHRFCEQSNSNPVPGGNGDNNDVWFISFETALQETQFVDNDSEEDKMWQQWAQGLAGAPSSDLGPTEFQKVTVFHPKANGHTQTAGAVRDAINARGSPPPPVCQNSNAGPVPQSIHIPDLTGGGEDVTPNSLLSKIREVICGDPHHQCQMPSTIDSHAGAVVLGDKGRCEISIGIQGASGSDGVEAYMLRDQSITNDAQVQACWDTTLSLINNCVANQGKEGWQPGTAPLPAFYQTGYRKLNSGAHGAIAIPLKPTQASAQGAPPPPPPPPFKSNCAKGDGPCQGNGCTGVSNICTAGTYKGCSCGSDSKFGTMAGPTHQLQCANDCCDSAANQALWFTALWCPANCGGFSNSNQCYKA